jgi:hypothetical protein
MSKSVVAAITALVLVAAGCGSSPKARPAAGVPSSTVAAPTVPPTTSRPATTLPSTTRPAAPAPHTIAAVPLPPPAAMVPLDAPALAGEGVWRPAGDAVGAAHAVYTAFLRPPGGATPAGLAWMDPRLARLVLYAGIGQPYGVWPEQGSVAAPAQPYLMAAFNSGFKIYDYRTGWYDQGRLAMPLVNGMASLVIYADGTATVGDWGRDVTLTPQVVAVRQNLALLVDHGAATPASSVPSAWGAVLGGGDSTWRSGLGVTASGALVYAGGPYLVPAQLASLLVAAGAVRAMQLDINPEWVVFATYQHAAGIGGSGLTGADLVAGMNDSPYHFLAPSSRDFFALFART